MDQKLLENIKKVEHLSGYLRTRFTLTSADELEGKLQAVITKKDLWKQLRKENI